MYFEIRHNAYTEQVGFNGNASDGIRNIPDVHLGRTPTILRHFEGVLGRPGKHRGATSHQTTTATYRLVSDSLSSIYLPQYTELLTAILNCKRTKTNKDYELGITWLTDNVACFQVRSRKFSGETEQNKIPNQHNSPILPIPCIKIIINIIHTNVPAIRKIYYTSSAHISFVT